MQILFSFKKEEMLAHATMNFGNYPATWINFEEIILWESQLQKDKYTTVLT